ncbi:TLDc domain-containing protein 1 [Schizosaccharomyces octosporus yFS286]|uniref:Oxidation resistance protein 1 n=1 Tax=Schizosaccharomyces octosporus (strain yFS286) TaxID=483514 RepID=S9PXZ5_SCHOY|nr:TLDc domain-containing protein 1 [Schizosaccharomyces octosporus yFS286]EPX73951.1 TLDc domain-containing protein 1 [Schizosaccharomyces octosporus yFS286]
MSQPTRVLTADDGLIDEKLAQGIAQYLPPRCAAAEVWKRLYSLQHDGASLHTMYQNCMKQKEESGNPKGACLLVAKDVHDNVFGAFVDEYLCPRPHYVGSNESFLWKCFSDNNRLRAFPCVGDSNFVIYCTRSFIALGGGNGRYSLWINGTMEYGYSDKTPAFNNSPLSHRSCQNQRIWIVDVELWCIE